MGKVEGQVCAEEDHSSQADECSYAEEIVGDDEGAVDGEKEGENSIEHKVNECSWAASAALCHLWLKWEQQPSGLFRLTR
jgi:hypothetical protein